MDIDKIKEIVKAAVDDSLSEKERATAFAEMEAIIAEAKTSIDDLTEALATKESAIEEKEEALSALGEAKETVGAELAAKVEEFETLQAKIENLEADVAEKAATIETAEVSFVDLKAKFDDLGEKVMAAELAERLTKRVSKLEEAKVLRTSKEAIEKQRATVNEMTDEDFESYVAEMTALKKEFSVSDVPAPPKEVASFNFETISEEMAEKYKKLGEALAERAGASARD